MSIASLIIGILTALPAGFASLLLAAIAIFGLAWINLLGAVIFLAVYANMPAIVGLTLGWIALHRSKRADRIAAWGVALCALTFAPWVFAIGIALRGLFTVSG